jgi:hypothetical protein
VPQSLLENCDWKTEAISAIGRDNRNAGRIEGYFNDLTGKTGWAGDCDPAGT